MIDMKKLTIGQLVELSRMTERDAISGDGAFHFSVSQEIQSREAAGERPGRKKLACVKPIRPGNHDWLVVTVAGVPGFYAGCRRFSQTSWGVYFREGDPLRGDPHTLVAFGQRPGQEADATSRQDAIDFATKCLAAGRIV